MITDELLNELEQKEKAATPGPWYAAELGAILDNIPGLHRKIILSGTQAWPRDEDKEVAVDARNALPDLLAEVRSLRTQLAAIKAAVGPMMEAGKVATPGPWDVRHEFNVFSEKRSVANCGGLSSNVNPDGIYAQNKANAAFVSAARAAADALEGLLDATA